MNGQFIFVYGTLRRGGNTNMHGLLASHSEYLCTGETQGKLYALKEYPGMIESGEITDKVFGEVYKISNSRQLLALLDDYEECSEKFPLPHEYVRKKLPVKLLSGAQVLAWVYLFNRDVANLKVIKSGDYIKHSSEQDAKIL